MSPPSSLSAQLSLKCYHHHSRIINPYQGKKKTSPKRGSEQNWLAAGWEKLKKIYVHFVWAFKFNEDSVVTGSEIRNSLQPSLTLATCLWGCWFRRRVPNLLISQGFACENTCLPQLQRNGFSFRAVTNASDVCKRKRNSQPHTTPTSLKWWLEFNKTVLKIH